MLEANFISGYETVTVQGLTQWDKGQNLQITGLATLPTTFQVHFANTTTVEAIVMLGSTVAGVGTVDIPNSLLEAGLDIKGWIYIIDANGSETIKTILFPLVKRTKPADFISEPNPTEQTLLEQTLSGVNAATANMQTQINTTNGQVALKASQTSLDATNVQLALKANKSEVTNVMTPKGTLAYASLPTTGNTVGWYYYCPDGDGTHGAGNYVWNGTAWYFGGTGNEGFSMLNGDLEDLESDFSKVTKKEFENLNDGVYMLGYPNASGVVNPTGYSFGNVNYLPVVGGKSIEFYSPNISWIVVAEYNSAKEFTLRTLYISERRVTDAAAIKKLTLQANTAYVRIFVYETVDSNKINTAVIALYYSDNATNAFYERYKSISTISPLVGTTNKIRKEITAYLNCINAYLQTSDGKTIAYSNSLCTGYIDINAYDHVYFEGRADSSGVSLWIAYDANYNMLGNRAANITGKIRNLKISFADILLSYPTAKYIRISSVYDANMKISAFVEPSVLEMYDAVSKQNVLWGKKYVACGDSFTVGDFAGGTDYDYNYQCFKTYPWYIASRNNMNFINEAISGTTMNSTKANAFSIDRYKAIPLDADYITLMFGLNETDATIGTISDTTTTTVLGAWNVVLEYLITNHPYAKIGIILADSWLASAVYNAMKQVAEYWGIPYLDLRADKNLPMGINGRLGSTINPTTISLRNTAFQISPSDSHPNPKAHEYRSTIVEEWLRRL